MDKKIAIIFILVALLSSCTTTPYEPRIRVMNKALIIDSLIAGYYKTWLDYHTSPVTSPIIIFNVKDGVIKVTATRQITLPADIDTNAISNLTVGNGLLLPVEVNDFELFILYGFSESEELIQIQEPVFNGEKGYWKINGAVFFQEGSISNSIDALWHYYFPKEIISIKAESEFFQ